jgi:isoaspartyl peptidase/L-asparaginase-like protein (Ntn-hydrolase superfamily)
LINKRWGRADDTLNIGSGTYANNKTGSVSSNG